MKLSNDNQSIQKTTNSQELSTIVQQWNTTLNPKTWQEVLSPELPQINTLIKKYGNEGEALIAMFIIDCINDMLDFLSVPRMNDAQVAFTTELIIEK